MGISRNYHIFVVDDELQVCKAVRQILCQKYDVTCFESAEACLMSLGRQDKDCDLLISDIKMPGMNGLELLQKVKRVRPLLAVMLITGYGDIPLAIRAMKAGAWDFIEKPLHRDKLLEATEAALRKLSFFDPAAGKPLTKREKKILKLITDGYSNRQIAQTFHRSIRTIEDQRRKLMHKLGVDNVVDLVKRALKIDLTDPD